MRSFEITKREVLASISIIAVMMLAGILISGKITEYQVDKNEVYNKAAKIESPEMFSYGMRTNVGNAFVYGTLEALDPVSYPAIDGSYMRVKKIKEKYTMHTRIVAHTDSRGNTTYTTETYWSWDYAGEESKSATLVSFCNETFPISKFQTPGSKHIKTVYESPHVRYEYYGVGVAHEGTVFTRLSDRTISDGSPFYSDLTIAETVDRLESNAGVVVLFWVFWLLGTSFVVFKFYQLENDWLE